MRTQAERRWYILSAAKKKENLRDLRTGYEKLKERMPASDKDYLEKYMEQAERVAFEEQQEAYLQECLTLSRFCKGQV